MAANEFTYTATAAAAASSAVATDLTDRIANVAAGPRRVRTDAGEVTEQPLPDLIKAQQYLAAESLADDSDKRTFGIRMGQLVPPGAISEDS